MDGHATELTDICWRHPMSAPRWLPTRGELDAATARTAAAMANPALAPADRQRAAELEEKIHADYLRRPGAEAELQIEAELEAAF